MVRVLSRLGIVVCGVITALLSRPYSQLRGFDAYTRTRVPWTAFSTGLISIGALAIIVALVPDTWVKGSPDRGLADSQPEDVSRSLHSTSELPQTAPSPQSHKAKDLKLIRGSIGRSKTEF